MAKRESEMPRHANFAIVAALLCARLVGAEDAPKVFDVHLHAIPSADRMLLERPPNPLTRQPTPERTEEQLRAALIAEMRRNHVVAAVVSSDDPRALRAWFEKPSARLLAGIGFDSPSSMSVDTLTKEHGAGRLDAISEVGVAYAGLAPNDPALDAYFALAEKLDVPVGIHLGTTGGLASYGCCPRYRMALNDPLLLEDVLIAHPRLRLYVMHAGWPFGEHMIALLAAHPQVYVDVGVICWVRPRAEFHAYLEKLVVAGYGKRIMFGSDAMIWPEAIGAGIEGITSAPFLSPSQKADILYNNAARFFRLPENAP
jgi:predicted TIM-barrel fold metal-dependent hydrolase